MILSITDQNTANTGVATSNMIAHGIEIIRLLTFV